MTQKNRTLEGKNRTLGGRGQKSSKIVGHHLCTFPKLNFLFPILQDIKKIPQFEGLLMLSKATIWGIF